MIIFDGEIHSGAIVNGLGRVWFSLNGQNKSKIQIIHLCK